jgi:hypothetical protein
MLLERVVFTTSKFHIEMNPKILYAASRSELVIEVIPVNIIGFRTPFSKAPSAFVIEEGQNLVEIIQQDGVSSAVIKSKGKEGEVVIGIYSVKSGAFLGRVLVKILPGEMA